LRLPEKRRAVYRQRLEELPMTIATNINLFECDFMTGAAS
jgi:hypothetical protein